MSSDEISETGSSRSTPSRSASNAQLRQQMLDMQMSMRAEMEVQVALVRAEAALERNRISILETAEPIVNSTDADRGQHDLDDSFMNNAVNSTQP